MPKIIIEEVDIKLTRKELKDLKDRLAVEMTKFVSNILAQEGLEIDTSYDPEYIKDFFEIFHDNEGFLENLTKKTELIEDSISIRVSKITK